MDFQLATLTEYESGFLGVQCDGYGEEAGMPLGEYQAPLGLYARANDPERDASGQPSPEKACMVSAYWEGGRMHVAPTIDPRIIAQLPELQKGATLLYGGTPSSTRYVHVDGSTVTLGALDGAKDIARAPDLLTYLDALEVLVVGIVGNIADGMPPAAGLKPMLTAFQAIAALAKPLIPATKAKAA